MDPFVKRLIERLHDPARPLSRNRHFHTFETPEGRRALQVSRRLKSLQRDILAAAREGRVPTLYRPPLPAQLPERVGAEPAAAQVELTFERVSGRRTALLTAEEFELLLALPGVGPALEPRPESRARRSA